MGKHETGYARVARDFYPTPPWVTAALVELVDVKDKHLWECACGDGRMSEALKAAGARVYSTDIMDRGYAGFDGLHDFLLDQPSKLTFDGTVTNPPFGPRGKSAEAFIEVGLRHMGEGFLALLLPADFDSATTRPRLFRDCPLFAAKIVLTRRIVWFSHPDPKKERPKENSAWFLWGNVPWLHMHRIPTIRYAPAGARPDLALSAGAT